MKNESVLENAPKTSLAAEKSPAESNAASTWRMIGNTELVAGGPRQIRPTLFRTSGKIFWQRLSGKLHFRQRMLAKLHF